MTAPLGIDLESVIGGGDCRTLLASMDLRSSEVASGDGWFIGPL